MPWPHPPKLKHNLWDFPDDPVVKILPSIAGGAGLIPGQGTKIPHASRQKTKTYCNKFNKDI